MELEDGYRMDRVWQARGGIIQYCTYSLLFDYGNTFGMGTPSWRFLVIRKYSIFGFVCRAILIGQSHRQTATDFDRQRGLDVLIGDFHR